MHNIEVELMLLICALKMVQVTNFMHISYHNKKYIKNRNGHVKRTMKRIQGYCQLTYSLLSEPPGKPKDTGVGSLSLLHWIFPTQELKGLLHCRKTLYQLSYQGSPINWDKLIIKKKTTLHFS